MKTYIATDSIVVLTATEGASETGDLSVGFVDGDDVSSTDLLLGEGVNHLRAQLIHRFHICSLQCDASNLITSSGQGTLNLDFHNLSADNFAFLGNFQGNGLTECLGQGFRLAHLERVNLTRSQGGEGGILSETLRNTHSNGRLTRSRLTCQENHSSGDLTVLDHFSDDSSSLHPSQTAREAPTFLARH